MARLNAEAKPVFDGAAEGRLLVEFRTACGACRHEPRAICPPRFSERTERREAKGTGTICRDSILRRGVVGPSGIADATHDEDVAMLANIVDRDLDPLRIGEPVKVVFKPTADGPPLAMFAPVDTRAAPARTLRETRRAEASGCPRVRAPAGCGRRVCAGLWMADRARRNGFDPDHEVGGAAGENSRP